MPSPVARIARLRAPGIKPAPLRAKLTKSMLEALRPPVSGRLYVYDTQAPGLQACLTSNSVLSFYLYRRIKGRPTRLMLGRFPAMTVEQARRKIATLLGDVAEGADPQAIRRDERGEWTLGELFAWYLDQHAKPHKKTWPEDERQFNVFLAAWRNRKLSAIGRRDVLELHARVGRQNGHYAANRLLALVRCLFGRAAAVGWQGANPAAGVKKFKEQSRERFLSADELPKFFAALEAEPNGVLRDFFKLALLTGARRANVQAMRWQDVDFERNTWTIPDTKAGEPQTVTLSPDAVKVLRAREKARGDKQWVFPTRAKGGHLREPKSAWKRLLDRAGLADLRIHDLRRTLGSWQAAGGASLPIIGKSLGHRQQSTTAIYARLNLDPVRESVNSATAAMMAAAKGPKRKGRKSK